MQLVRIKIFYAHVDIIHGAALVGDDYSGSEIDSVGSSLRLWKKHSTLILL